MNTLIVTGGNIDINFLHKNIDDNHYDDIIAVDKGLESLYKLKIVPNHIVGDLDSVNSRILNFYIEKNVDIHKYNKEKDYTDTDIAIKLAITLNSNNIIIIGATGTRFDHTLANVHVLIQCLNRNIPCQIINENNRIYLANSEIAIKKSSLIRKLYFTYSSYLISF